MIDPDDKVAVQAAAKDIRKRLERRYQYRYHRFKPTIRISISRDEILCHRQKYDPKHNPVYYLHYYKRLRSYLYARVEISECDALIMMLMNNDTGWTEKIVEKLFEIVKIYYPDTPVKNSTIKSSDNGCLIEMEVFENYDEEPLHNEGEVIWKNS